MNRNTRRGAAFVCAAVLVASGCGSTSSDTKASAAKGDAAVAAPSDSGPPPVTADIRGCAGAEAVIGHIRVETVGWSPTLNPFDKTVSKRLASQARDLAVQGPRADDPAIRKAIHDTAETFAGVAQAMKSRKREQLNKAISQSRVVYKELTQVCSLGDEEE